MYLVWHRWGLLAIAIPFISLIAVQLGVNSVAGEGYYEQTQWPKVLGIVLGSITVGVAGYFLNRRNHGLQGGHRFFWIPLEYWSVVILTFGLWVLFS